MSEMMKPRLFTEQGRDLIMSFNGHVMTCGKEQDPMKDPWEAVRHHLARYLDVKKETLGLGIARC